MLLLDESFSALDWDMRTGCFDALKDLCNTRGMSVLLVSHDDRDAAYLGCKIMRLSTAVP
jgi:ABC-type nitrate/sulfonate/bicarbonate transport system ATPase subunit